MQIPVPPVLEAIAQTLHRHHAKMVLVGGSVRDYFLDIPIKDYDIEVYGLKDLETLEEILSAFGKVKEVGKSFGILKLLHEGKEYDFAFPRLERKTGRGHRGFAVTVDGALDFASAARRRDFTINAMGYIIEEKRLLDPFGGREDLRNKILRHIDDETFVEDPLRVLRGVQFCARFDLSMYPDTLCLCREMVASGMLHELPKERIYEEIKKLLLQARKPSKGFALMQKMGALALFPWLGECDPQTLQHTLRRLDRTAESVRTWDEKERMALSLAALVLEGGAKKAEETVLFVSDEVRLRETVARLVAAYPEAVKTAHDLRNASVRRLSLKAPIRQLVVLLDADGKTEEARLLEEAAKRLGVFEHAPAPLLLGRDLVQKLKLSPSPKFKEILDKVYEAQIEGQITSRDEALDYVKKELL